MATVIYCGTVKQQNYEERYFEERYFFRVKGKNDFSHETRSGLHPIICSLHDRYIIYLPFILTK